MGFYELWEFYKYGSNKSRFVRLEYLPDGRQDIVSDRLPVSHGMGYFYMRNQFKALGDVMGFDNPRARIEKRDNINLDDCIGI